MIRVLSAHNPRDIDSLFGQLHVDKTGVKIMFPKTKHFLIYIDSLNVPAANVLKQELLSLGADAALHKGACDFSVRETPCLLIGNLEHFNRLTKKLQAQPFGLKKLGTELHSTLENFRLTPAPIKAGPYSLDFSNKPLLMGIINVTPDSFSNDGLDRDLKATLKRAEQLMQDGADVLDIGGESTRPGSVSISVDEERKRVIPAIKEIAKRFKIPISVDTSKSKIAEASLGEGAHIVNDVTGLSGDPWMLSIITKYKCPAVVMHHRIQKADVIADICEFFTQRLKLLENENIPRENVILDPGIGFGKKPGENLLVLKHLAEFKIFGRPLLLGTSRKSFIGKVIFGSVSKNHPERSEGPSASDRLPGTLASIVHGYLSGAHIFRVHDVKEARQALSLTQAIEEAHE